MRRYGCLIGVHLSHQERLQEPPRCHKRVQIAHRLPQLERPQHIAIDIDVTRQVSVGELDLIETGEGPYRIPVVHPDAETRSSLAETPTTAIGKRQLEGHACVGECPRNAIEPEAR